ncbi:YheC/YheD family protein [Bacillus sp. Marseille-Q1617]|uniref:YheC/YheD family endospore coat-associated protein n=1 Tax=Bacillus sp. Marseille-Q1617 TaxID=2736887 RepID=UPI00158C5246|nr:YheC/YheD family protein [Bacillus sp. Marseille-Q1617]
MIFKCPFISFENLSSENELILPNSIFRKFDSSGQLMLKAGASFLWVNCSPSAEGNAQVILKTRDPFFTSIPQLENVLLKIDKDQHSISLGPITALMIDQGNEDTLNTHSLKEYFTECHRWFQQKGGLFYLLPVSSFLKNDTEGFVFDYHEWQKRALPLPHVIYNRSHSRKIESHQHYESALKRVEDHSVHLFNSSFLSKDAVHSQLQNHSQIQPHLPQTVQGLDRLDEMLAVHKDIFIKAVNGSRGRYIIRIQQRERDYLVFQNSFSSKRTLTFPTYSSLYRQIQSWCRSSNYIVQQTIPFITVKEQPLDFRFLCHKNHKGIWTVISAVARIASENQFVANVDQGGRMEPPQSILSSLFSHHDSQSIFSNMKSLSLSASSFLSEHLKGHYAEFGIDIGVDSAGKPWIIEINSKPSKKTFIANDRVRPSVKALYEYSYNLWNEKED